MTKEQNMDINLSKLEISTILSLLHPQDDREILNKLNHALDRLESRAETAERMMKGTATSTIEFESLCPNDPVNW
jgi:hypothetical protein